MSAAVRAEIAGEPGHRQPRHTARAGAPGLAICREPPNSPVRQNLLPLSDIGSEEKRGSERTAPRRGAFHR